MGLQNSDTTEGLSTAQYIISSIGNYRSYLVKKNIFFLNFNLSVLPRVSPLPVFLSSGKIVLKLFHR